MTLTNYLQKLDESSALPLYQQLQRALRTAIEKRIVGPDDALPPERDLADELSVSRITVRKAIDGLVDEAFIGRHALLKGRAIHERFECRTRLPPRLRHVVELVGFEVAAADPCLDVTGGGIDRDEASGRKQNLQSRG